MGVIITDEGLRAMYAGGRGNTTARRFARLWAAVFARGLLPKRWVTLEVTGRRSGRPTRFPLGMADWQGEWYLVPMLGEGCNWVRNVRAADGRAILWRRRPMPCRLAEVPVSERPPIIKRYLEKVPGGRPHIPVGRHAPLAEFAAIAPRYPVFRVLPSQGRPARKRHWGRWLLGGVAALIVLGVLLVGLAINLQPSPARLALPAAPAAAPAGALTGTWDIAAGSVAGFRVQQTALGFSGDVAGRTHAVTGALVIADGEVTRAQFRIGLAAVRVNGKAQPQFARGLGVARHPGATFTLTRPLRLSPRFASGAVLWARAAGDLTMNGVTRPVTVTFAARRDGAALQAAGSAPVAFARWGIRGPQGYGPLGSLASHGVAEVLLILHHG